jgi:hypothetical protein
VAKRSSKKSSAKKPAKAPRGVSLGAPRLRWLDSVADSIAANGGPRFTRSQILQALVDANTSRTLDPNAIRSLEQLRVAFGALDVSAVERLLRERPKLEPNLLDALRDSIK